ncbi:unnamed protein product [Bemisia tabaci]|uniref:Uncharacterized protein n=2 Tax=Bemisia tabaci TaxID=7038 RepID=A0A9P0CEQ5_BEMTA|nr:unnamed protein product [Bemisia tabaci]
MRVVSLVCLLMVPVHTLTRKRGEGKQELNMRLKGTASTTTVASVEKLLSNESSPLVNQTTGAESQLEFQINPTKPPSEAISGASSNVKSRLSDFDKLSMSVEQSIEEVKNPLHEKQGYFPNILSPSTYVQMQPVKSSHVKRQKAHESKGGSMPRPAPDQQYFPSPEPAPPDINPFQPEIKENVRYVYPSNQGPMTYHYQPQNNGGYSWGYAPQPVPIDINPFQMKKIPRMVSSKRRPNPMNMQHKEIAKEEASLKVPNFYNEVGENFESGSFEHKYADPEDAEETEGNPEQGESLEEVEDEKEPTYPAQKIKTIKEVYRTPIVEEIDYAKHPKKKKKPPAYVENTVRHHEFSIKNTYPANPQEELKPSEIPSLEQVTKFVPQGPLLRAPSTGVSASVRLTPFYTIYPRSVVTFRPVSPHYRPRSKGVTIFVRNGLPPLRLTRQPPPTSVTVHRHQHRHVAPPSAPLCAPCSAPLKQKQKHAYPTIQVRPLSHKEAAKLLRSTQKYKSPKKQVGCVTSVPYLNGRYRINPLYHYDYNYPQIKVPKGFSTYPVYFPRFPSALPLKSPYKFVEPSIYAKQHFYTDYARAPLLEAKTPTADYQVQESEEEAPERPTAGGGAGGAGSQEEYGGSEEEDDAIRNQIESDYQTTKYHDDQHFKPEDESRTREVYTDYGPDEEESKIKTSKFQTRRPRSNYAYSHQIHYY